MESQPQNPEFRINPENLHPCSLSLISQNRYPWLSMTLDIESQFPKSLPGTPFKKFCASLGTHKVQKHREKISPN